MAERLVPGEVLVGTEPIRANVGRRTVTIRVTNFGPDVVEVPCTVVLPDGAEIPIFVELPPEGEAEERITVPREAKGGVGRATCEDPDLPFDDSRYFHLPRVGASRVLVESL